MIAIVNNGKDYTDEYAAKKYVFKRGEPTVIPDEAAKLFFGFVFNKDGELIQDEKLARKAAIRAGFGDTFTLGVKGECIVNPNKIGEFMKRFTAYPVEVEYKIGRASDKVLA